ncbi:MAG: ATP-binding protein [Candidatus Saccharimonadales bacterium]
MTVVVLCLLLLCGLVSFVIGSFVIARDWKKAQNLAFFGLSLGISAWALGIAGFVQTNSLTTAIVWAKFYYVAPLLLVFSSVLFAVDYLYTTKISKKFLILFGFTGLILAILLVFGQNFMITGIAERAYGKEVLLNGRHYLLYSVYLLACFVLTIAITFKKMRAERYRIARQQVKTFLFGYTVSCILGVFFNLILPGLGNYSLIIVGPLCTTFFLFATAYAIVRHKLFDIRAVVARSVAYAASLVALATLYGVVVFTLANFVFGLHLSLQAQIYLSIATGLAGLLFQRPIAMFDKITNTVFYRDAYDAQELFDHLNRILVSSLDLNYLLKHSSVLLAEKLKAEYVLMGLKDETDARYRISGTAKMSFDVADIEKVRALTPKFRQSVIVADYLDEKHAELKSLMITNNISVLVRLSPDVHKGDEGFGYIVLGAKKSGNPYGNQDVRVLDTVANELIIAIQNALHFEEIQRFNATLQTRVEDATRQLRRTNSKLEALDETKDDFISMASHQLRTPLTSVKGYLSMVIDGDAGKINDTQRKMLGQAFISSQRMVYLIADLLNVSRLKTGKFIIDWAPVDLSKVIDEEISQLVETAESRGIKLSYKKPAAFPVLNMDETKTRQVIMNFVDNAIYYTPSGGAIDVQLLDKNASIELRIVDNGIGVPKAEQHHLFTKFYRARNAQKARPDGTGLGLFMAKKVIVAQGGAIVFESREGQGSTFGFSFSKARLNPTNNLVGAPEIGKTTTHSRKA